MFKNRKVPAAGLLLALAACDAGSVSGPDTGATITGSVGSTVQIAPYQPAGSGLAAAPSGQAAQASSVAAAAVLPNGSLQVLAEAQVQANGRFSIDDVPAGRTGLVVSARASGGAEVGRVLVHGKTETGGTLVTEPINGETTVEGLVYSALVAAGVPEEIRNTAQLALLLRLRESSAAEVAQSAQAIGQVANAYRAGAEALVGALSSLQANADAAARAQAWLEAAQEHARNRDAGMGGDAAQEAFLAAALGALEQGGASADRRPLVTAAAATALDRALEVAHEEARLDIAKNALQLNLRSREELVAGLPSSPERSGAQSALQQVRTQARAAASLSSLVEALLNAEAAFEAQLLESIMARLHQVPANVREMIHERLQAAFETADLSSRLAAASGVEGIVQAVAEYRAKVLEAVEQLRSALPQGSELIAATAADLLIAARGGPAIGRRP